MINAFDVTPEFTPDLTPNYPVFHPIIRHLFASTFEREMPLSVEIYWEFNGRSGGI